MKNYASNSFIESINTSLNLDDVSKYYGKGLGYISLAKDIKLDATEHGWVQ